MVKGCPCILHQLVRYGILVLYQILVFNFPVVISPPWPTWEHLRQIYLTIRADLSSRKSVTQYKKMILRRIQLNTIKRHGPNSYILTAPVTFYSPSSNK